MMRGASRIAARSVPLSVPLRGVAATLTASQRCFGSRYSDDLGHYKRPYATESRSGAHRHPPRNEVLREQRAAAAATTKPVHNEVLEEDVEADAPPSSPKNHYPELYKKKTDERLAFTSNFREPDMKPILNAAHRKPQTRPQHRVGVAAADLDDTDVTRIYSKEEVRNMAQRTEEEPGEVMTAAADDVLDVLSTEDAAPKAAAAAARPTATEELDVADTEDDVDEFAEIRSHPFFTDMLRRVERNMIRFRKETRSLGRYSVEAVNECVRPLLQLTDYPLTATQLSHLSHSISPAVLKSSLRERSACRRLQLYRSQDTDLLLDWSVEDFLRRRYESVHLSWEPMDVICRRFGWTPEMLSDRDYLLYFSAFPDYVEMAELQSTTKGEPRAVPITDPVARATEDPIPADRLLLRRKASADAEPSLTESIRLMGSPAVNTPLKGKKAQRMRQHGGDNVADYFSAVESAANDVDGVEAVKLRHAADTVPPLRQASHPGGRSIREFSLPKSHAAPSKSTAPAAPETPVDAAADVASNEGGEAPFDQKKFEELSNAYHNTKVENSLLRRRMLATDSPDKAQELQAELAKGRREVARLEQELELMRELKRHTMATSTAATGGFHVPRGLPQYAEAPEFDGPVKSKNASAVEDIDDDEIEQALRDYKEEEELLLHSRAAPARVAAASAAYTATSAAPTAAADEDEYEEVEVEVDDVDGDLTAAEEQGEDVTDVVAADAEADSQDAPLVEVRATSRPATAKHDQQWQEELEAAVEQHEAEMEEDEDFSAALRDTTTPATTPSARLQQLASLHDRLSSAADRARRYLGTVETRRTEVLEKIESQLADANRKVGKLEEQLSAVEEEQTALQDAMAREEAEHKALEVEAQLTAQREKRMAELQQQRERARLAQEEAARAVARQRAAEQEALAVEEELQRKLRDVQAQLRSLKDNEEEHHHQHTSATALRAEEAQEVERKDVATAPTGAKSAGSAVSARAASTTTVSAAAAEKEEDMSMSPASAGQFMCTPEQYDGLHLAADRLKKEIAALEAQMEEEGDEDDETLMAVLAASRADLEELEDCVASVQANATWAAARDAKLAKELTLSAQVADTEAHRLQSAIDSHRFQISLLEKRLHHTSQRNVMTKLRDRIAQNRKSISQLRMEQDRLRRAGRDALGLPASVSIAETLAHEGKEADEAKLAEEAQAAAAAAAETEGVSAEEESVDDTAEGEQNGDEKDEEWQLKANSDKEMDAAGGGERVSMPSSDADKLRLRLDSMVGDIQHLQDSIEAQERNSDYDDEETEVVLREMKEKLSQLQRLRDQVRRALVEESANGPADAGGPTPVIRPASGGASAAPVVGRAATPVRNGPSSSQYAREARISSASKKLRTAAPRSSATYRRR
ncbi:hypothetical protein ABB37_07568 [Leptomonas pyrrhocoris]|uniref:Uncharacterized protein n=1 Tax=Leptomonas pyrrhocoris TaxID=157538 RepID=A0A0N0DSY6_LEPPY|nr:hypothetical protein ABB37_07568 [Leptomonas pyrrhocoris]KPA76738.1 hypothetical protein ABB37_07568 [Leptomonas pyrrhocoris]|eukprot:XP_015655177.1 hypothetical protein ABB37_07568 [Leptomonas pyrrhocoris]